jgi:hypothetical protein
MLERYAREVAVLAESHYSFAFELFGSRLRILTHYDIPLDARLLYALDPATGNIVEPEAIAPAGFPLAEKLSEYPIDMPSSVLEREVLERCHTASSEVEGAVLYFVQGEVARVAKCKPAGVKERQARYRELYGYSKNAAKGRVGRSSLLEELTSYVDLKWSDQERTKYRSIVEIVRQDVARELAFDANAKDRSLEQSVREAQETVLFASVWGSHMWGMETSTSDRDRCVVYQVDERTVLLGAFETSLLQRHLTGWRRRTPEGDEHWYEIGRVIRLLLQGSLTMLYGVMSPLVDAQASTAHAELRSLLMETPSRVFFRALLRDVRASEKRMDIARDNAYFEKHLRIACRNLRFGITLFSEGRYEFRSSTAVDRSEMVELERSVREAYRSSLLPEQLEPQPFYDYLIRQRRVRRAGEVA